MVEYNAFLIFVISLANLISDLPEQGILYYGCLEFNFEKFQVDFY